VQFLRIFRDHSVEATFAGGAFMEMFNLFYYSFSPTVASAVMQHPVLQGAVRLLLYPLIASLHLSSVTFSGLSFAPELAITATGILASALIGLTYLTPVVAVAAFCSRHRRKQ